VPPGDARLCIRGLGSVAKRVLASSRVPVLLFRPIEQEPGVGAGGSAGRSMERLKLILVPVDGSAGLPVAVGSASRLARAAWAAVVLLQVIVPLPVWIYDPTLGLIQAR
jgi:nucleotide-binding universal stress UspA family protein